MIERTVICDRCGNKVEAIHPNRISIYTHHTEEYNDYFGKPHKKSVYKAGKPIHFCNSCENAFNKFMEIKHGTEENKDET